jgi:chromosome segregation ATPase
MYTYGDYLYFKNNWRNTYDIGIFLVYRPEKDTVVLDRDGSLNEIENKNVRIAAKIEVLNFYNGKIKEYLNQRDGVQRQIEECEKAINSNEQKKVHIEGDLPKVQIKLEALEVAYRLAGKEKANLPELEVQIKRIRQNISGCNKSINGCNNNINKMSKKREELLDQAKRLRESMDFCEAKKVEYLKKIGEYDGLQ